MTSVIVFDRKRIKQPTPAELLAVSRSNPLARGLVFAGMPGLPDPITGTMPRPIDAANSTYGSMNGARTLKSASNSSGGWYWPIPPWSPWYGITTRCTILVVHSITSGSSWMMQLGCAYTSGWSSPYHALSFFAFSAYDYGQFGGSADAVNGYGVSGDPSYYNAGTCHAVTREDTSVQFYRDGEAYGIVKTLANNFTPDFSNRRPITMMNRSEVSPGEGYAGECSVGLAWNRTLSPAEIRMVFLNPWQVFV